MFLLKTKLATKEDHLSFINEPPPVINCSNGELWIDQKGNLELRSHRPESFLRHCLSVDFDPKATCPTYDKAILEIFSRADRPEEMVRHWNELMGYIIQPRRNIPMITILWGRGDNGKGVLLRTAIKLLGEHLVCAQAVESFENNRFAMGSLFGKYLYVDDDVRAGVKLPDGFLKTISEAKLVTGEAKFKPSFNFIARALPILLCNNVPSLPDLSHGFRRRLRVIPFDRKFTADDKDETLFERIWATELSGILNRALSGLQRLASRGYRFAWPKSVLAATRRFIQDANPLPAFIASCCKKGSGEHCRLKDFYDTFCAWADENGITLKQQKLSVRKNLEHMGYPVRHRNDGERIFGLSLNGNSHA